MLATLVIGLREGLEAALIVGMVAAFLRRNGHSLKAMWLGVGAAVFLSALVGIVLEVVSAALPQRQQEAMETVIGAVAVVIVTFMIVWMSKNSRTLKSTLEARAGSALKGGSVAALAGMAFLAVLREGVETAVFLVAAFQSSLSPLAAGTGALLGLAVSSAAGVLLFRGAIKLNLAKFFKATGVFLVFVAAGLVLKSLRTAHEAGWLNTGQDRTVDLTWLAPHGSAQAAILTGVFGIPADPRTVEVLGWSLYLIPMLAFVLWPRTWRVAPALIPRVQFAAAGVLGAAAVALAATAPLAIPTPSPALSTTPAVTSSGNAAATLQLASANPATAEVGPGGGGEFAGDAKFVAAATGRDASAAADGSRTLLVITPQGAQSRITLTAHGTESHAGRTAAVYTADVPELAGEPGDSVNTGVEQTGTAPAQLTSAELIKLNGGRLPVGISTSANPGPFAAQWNDKGSLTVWLAGDTVLDAERTASTTITLSGGGLSTPRTIALTGESGWHVPDEHVTAAVSELNRIEAARSENVLFSRLLPVLLGGTGATLVAAGERNKRKLSAADSH